MAKYLDLTGLQYFWSKIKSYISGYVGLSNGTITIGNSTITPITSHQDISGKADKATTLAGYGITDAKIDNGVITLGSNNITPLTSHQDISGKADKSATVSTVLYDTTNKKITKTINGTSTDVVTAATIVTDGGAILSTNIGTANGICPLDTNSKVDASYLPSYVDDVIEAYARTGQTALSQNWLATVSASGTVIVPESGKIYVLMNSTTDYTENTQFRWGGSTYVKLNDGGISAMTTAEMDTATSNWT